MASMILPHILVSILNFRVLTVEQLETISVGELKSHIEAAEKRKDSRVGTSASVPTDESLEPGRGSALGSYLVNDGDVSEEEEDSVIVVNSSTEDNHNVRRTSSNGINANIFYEQQNSPS